MSKPRLSVFIIVSSCCVAISPQFAMSADVVKSITFDELKFETDKPFKRSMLSKRAESLNGQRVTIKGYIYPTSVYELKGIKKFVLVDDNQYNNGRVPHCYVILVDMKGDQSVDFSTRRIIVEGVFSIRERKHEEEPVYHIEAEKAGK